MNRSQQKPEASTIETASIINSNSAVNNDGNAENESNTIHNNTNETSSKNEVFLNTRNIADQRDDNPDTADFHVNQGQQDDVQNSPIHTETMLRTHHAYNEMLNHYHCIVVGSFKEIFQGVDTNNLQAVLQALQELNFILAKRAPKLSAHYGFLSEPHQISAEDVPDFVSAYLSRPTLIL